MKWKPNPRLIVNAACILAGIVGVLFGAIGFWCARSSDDRAEQLIIENDNLRKERAKLLDMMERALDRQNRYIARVEENCGQPPPIPRREEAHR